MTRKSSAPTWAYVTALCLWENEPATMVSLALCANTLGEVVSILTVLAIQTTWLRFRLSQNDGLMSLLGMTTTSNCFPNPHETYTMCLSTLIWCPWAYGSSLKKLYPQYLAQVFWFFQVTCGVKMTSLHCGWGWWQLPQTSSYMYYRNLQHYVWAHCWYAVHGHTVALNSYPHYLSLVSDCGVLVLDLFWSQNDVISSWLRLTAINSNWLLHLS